MTMEVKGFLTDYEVQTTAHESESAALFCSQEHWRQLSSLTLRMALQLEQDLTISFGSRHCALCVRYLASFCEGCPVLKATGESHCNGTPYWEAYSLTEEYSSLDENLPESRWTAAATAEYNFLMSLTAIH
jgi:hypothetical protein